MHRGKGMNALATDAEGTDGKGWGEDQVRIEDFRFVPSGRLKPLST